MNISINPHAQAAVQAYLRDPDDHDALSAAWHAMLHELEVDQAEAALRAACADNPGARTQDYSVYDAIEHVICWLHPNSLGIRDGYRDAA